VHPLCLFSNELASDSPAYSGAPFVARAALWVAPVVEQDAREREVALPRGEWIEAWSGRRVIGGAERCSRRRPCTPSLCGSATARSSFTYPAEHVAGGLGDTPEGERPLEATLWGRPRNGRAAARLADGTHIRWGDGRWSASPQREISSSVCDC
jgi:alpha-D-xyloside xylohydrolase